MTLSGFAFLKTRNISSADLFSDGEDGYSLEIFNAIGDKIAVITEPESAIAPLSGNEIFRVRSLAVV